jgi:Hint domain
MNQDDWQDSVGGQGGTNHNGGSLNYLWDGEPGNPNDPYNGYLYYATWDTSIQQGEPVDALLDSLSRTFEFGINFLVLCFAAGTHILTPEGERPIDDLQVGDFVINASGQEVQIRWIGSRNSMMLDVERLLPVRIAKDALGLNRPHRDLLVSQDHCIVLRADDARLMFGTDEVLVAAKDLVNDSTIRICREMNEVEYFHILFDNHEILMAENLETESLYPDEAALSRLLPFELEELRKVSPNLAAKAASGSHALPLLKSSEARTLLGLRH